MKKSNLALLLPFCTGPFASLSRAPPPPTTTPLFLCAAIPQRNLIWFFVIYLWWQENKHEDNDCINHRRHSGGPYFKFSHEPTSRSQMSAIRGNWWNVPASIPIRHDCEPFPSCAPLPHNELLAKLKPHGRWNGGVHVQSSRNMQTRIRSGAPPPSGWILTLTTWTSHLAAGLADAFSLRKDLPHSGSTPLTRRETPAVPDPGCAFVATGAFKPPAPLLTLLFTNTPSLPLTIKAPQTHPALKKRKLVTSGLT